MPHRPDSLHDMYYARGFPAYGHHPPRHSYPHQTVRSRGRSPLSSAGRSTPESDDYAYDSKSRMRWILSLGLLLPALAAIIGVVAWAVSAEVVMGARRESALKASEAFRLSQGPHDLEWRAVQEDDINHITHNVNLEPPHLAPIKESGSAASDDAYDDPETEDEKQETTTSSTTTSSSTASPTTSSSPPPTSRLSSPRSTLRSTTSVTTTIAPIRVTEAKHSLVKVASKNIPVNASTIFFLNGADSASDEAGKSGKKKSPGDQVADVINRLVAQRQMNGVHHRPHIVVVAPLHDPRKNNKSSTTRSFASSPTLSPRMTGSQNWSPGTTRRPTKTTPHTSVGKKSKSTTDDSETTTKPPMLSKDADTLLAAAQMLAARHKMISMRNDEDVSLEEDEERPLWVDPGSAPKYSPGHATSASSSSSASTTTTETSSSASTTPQPIPRFQSISAPHPYPHPLPPPPPQHQPPQYPHPNLHALAPVNTRPVSQPFHAPPSQSAPSPFHALPPPHPHPAPPRPLQRHPQSSSDRMGHLVPMASYYTPTHAAPPGGRSYPPPVQQHRPPPLPFAPPPPHHLHHVMPHAPHNQMRFHPNDLRLGPHPPPHPPLLLNQGRFHPNQQQQFIRGPQGQLFPVHVNGPMPMGPPHAQPTAATTDETATEAVDESQVATTYEGADTNPSKAVVQFHAEDSQPAASGANKGLTLHFGGGPVGGGGQLVTNPVGIFKTLLLPLLPKHHANFNGKLVFGFVLEKGVQKKVKPLHPVVKFLPSHLYRH